MKRYYEVRKLLPNDFNHKVINDFLLSLKIANRSEITIDLYRRFLERFFSEMNEPFLTLLPDVVQEWFAKNEGGVKESTLKTRLSILFSFFTFCVQEGHIAKIPLKRRWLPRLPQAIPKYLENEDIAKLRQYIEKESLRNQLLVEFLLTSGCRIAEVHALNIRDIDLDNRSARVLGKGKKIRQVHFSEKCAILMERYLDIHPQVTDALFVSSIGDGDRIGIRIMQKIIRKIGIDAGLSSPLYSHRLRHTFATVLLAKGAELSFIGDELGHRDLGTTQIYARLPKREVVAMYRKFMG